jgi:L-ribulose-5-phosphate 3-epimerase
MTTQRLKLAIVAESTGLPLRTALVKASVLGCRGIQFDAVGELAPDQLTGTGRREFKNLLRSHNFELAALNVPLRRGLDVLDDLHPRLDYIRKAMTLSYDLGASLVVAPFPELSKSKDERDPRANALKESLIDLGRFGDRTGCRLALEGGIDPGDALRAYLEPFDCGSLTVCYDPANFLLNGHDPLTSLAALGRFVSYAHARDARIARNAGGGTEVPLGAGDIEWMALVATLESLGYSGYLAVERTAGTARWDDVAAGVKFLGRFVQPDESARRT